MANNKQILSARKNKLLYYKKIKDLYSQLRAEHPYVPITTLHQVYIYPVYPISRTTLYQVLCTPINSELASLAKEKEVYSQTSLF